jgi:hypothetical protein
VDDTHRPAVAHQGRAEQRPDALLAQDRVQDVGVVDLGQEERLTRRRDAAREPRAEGDAHPLGDLLLDPLRRGGDELAPRRVEQEDGGRVGVEQLADPAEQLVEQLVEAEVRERRVRQQLDAPELILRVDLLVALRF